MSNSNNSTTTNRVYMNDLALKSWCSNLHTSASNKNRISLLPVPVSKNAVQEPFKKIGLAPARTLTRSSTTMSHVSWRTNQHNSVHIYLKSPHAVASGELAGSIVIHGDSTLVHKIKSIKLDLVGLEAVNDSSNSSNQQAFSFLHLSILQLTGPEQVTPYQNDDTATIAKETSKVIVPFLISLPSDLSGTYIDKKGSIQYYLKCKTKWYTEKATLEKQAVVVYSNMALKSPKDATTLYTQVLLNKKQVWKTAQQEEGHVSIETSMPRSVWMSGAPIYVTVKIQNDTLKDTVNDIKLELLRKQKTFSIDNRTQSMLPVTSSCKVIGTTSLADLGWWEPLQPTSQNQVTLTIDTPSNQVTVRNQKLIDVSFSIRLSIQSVLHASTVISDIPVMLAHPISMDPPPGNYTKSVTSGSNNTEECHLSVQKVVSSVYSSCTDSNSTQAASDMNIPPRKKFSGMKKSLSNWGLQMSRKLSISSGLNTHSGNSAQDQQPNTITEEKEPKLKILSPSPTSSSLHSSIFSSSSHSLLSDQANEEINKTIPEEEEEEEEEKGKEGEEEEEEEEEDEEEEEEEEKENPEKSMMKFGQIIGPKRFGQQPGCLGDAGLDIRNCFNVATATEAIQSYAAEKVEISNHDEKYYPFPPYLEPTQFTKLTKKKVPGYRIAAPQSEKCEIDSDMMSNSEILRYEYENYVLSSEDDTLGETQPQPQPQQHSNSNANNSSKRMLASCRHLRNVQRKNVQVSAVHY